MINSLNSFQVLHCCFLEALFLFVCACMHVSIEVYMQYMHTGTHEGQKRVSDLLKLEL